MVIFYKKCKKYNEIQLTKNKMDLNIRKMTNPPPSHGFSQTLKQGKARMKKDKTRSRKDERREYGKK